jgi:hypothetical protein
VVRFAIVIAFVSSACSSGGAAASGEKTPKVAEPVVERPSPPHHVAAEPAPLPPPPPVITASGKSIDITLRSTPSGARAAVDGVPAGNTPTHYPMIADGRQHEFTFDHPGHALARYRFVPVQSGVIHARLEAVPLPDTPDTDSDATTPLPEVDKPKPPEPNTPPPMPGVTRVGPQP